MTSHQYKVTNVPFLNLYLLFYGWQLQNISDMIDIFTECELYNNNNVNNVNFQKHWFLQFLH